MKFVALISGGKDSIFNILHCLANDHELVALANLRPANKTTQELDSFMFQTVGHDILDYYPQMIGVPLYRGDINGYSKNQKMDYNPTKEDEIEDLYELLSHVKSKHPDVQGVSVGAILSSYQRTRVENVCSRLGLTSLAYLWQRDQGQLMAEMVSSPMEAIFVKVAAVGLNAKHLGLTLKQGYSQLLALNAQFDLHICGEGGEFETLVIDAPFFEKKLVVVEKIVQVGNDDVCYLYPKVELKDKEQWSDISDKNVNWKEFIGKGETETSLLDEPFQEIYDNLENNKELFLNPEVNPPESIATSNSGSKPSTTVKKVGNNLYISNIQSETSLKTIEEQTKSVFTQLHKYIDSHQIQTSSIQHSTLLLSSMSDFAAVNSIYVSHFNEAPIPPSRVCVETVLPTGTLVQLSVIVILNAELYKSGLHVQGRSYWAPANIGPYSQAVISQYDHTASLSGQIPLIPASMDLSQNASLLFDSVLSLQHLHNVKKLTGCINQLSVTSFIKSSSSVSSVVESWKSYTESCEIEGENPQDCLLIVQVSELPRSADVEWGGFSYKKIVDMYADDDSDLEDEDDDKLSDALKDLQIVDSKKVHKANEGTFYVSITLTENEFETFKFASNCHYTVYYTRVESLKKPLGSSNVSADFVPVAGVWNCNGEQADVGIIITGCM